MIIPDSGPGYAVSAHMLYPAALYLNDQAQALAGARNSFNDACYAAARAFGSGLAASAFNDFFTAWFSALDAQAETMGSAADATEQCAVIYDHAERTVLGDIAAMPTAPPPAQSPDITDPLRPRLPEA